MSGSRGPLAGVRVVEFASLAPGSFAGMVMADLGADVVRIDRIDATSGDGRRKADLVGRGKRSIRLDLKSPDGVAVALKCISGSDALIEGFRPGVMERLGLGPDVCARLNPGLVYGRLTGWGQDGPLATAAGHDINYMALTGVLDETQFGQVTTEPVKAVGPVTGGGSAGLLLGLGICAALVERARSGLGQTIDAAMVDTAALLGTWMYALDAARGSVSGDRSMPRTPMRAPSYGLYRCKDLTYMSVAATEDKFFAELVTKLGVADGLPDRHDEANWDEIATVIGDRFRTRTQAEWVAVFAGSDCCVAPVLGRDEAPRHPHNAARGTFLQVDDVVRPVPAPRFDRSSPDAGRPAPRPGQDTHDILREAGCPDAEIARLLSAGVVG